MAHLPYTQAEQRKMVQLWNKGANGQEIALVLGRNHVNVCIWLRRMVKAGEIASRDKREGRPVDWLALRAAFRAECQRIMKET